MKEKHIAQPTIYERTWYAIDGELKIDSNNTFEYKRSTCVSISVSKGNWRISNDTLILNSFPAKGCYFIEEFDIKTSMKTLNYHLRKITEKDCEPNSGYVLFNNEKFYIIDSLLISKKSANKVDGNYNHHMNFRKMNYFK